MRESNLLWVWLSLRPGLGPVKQRKLLDLAGSPAELYAAGEEALARMGISQAARTALLDKSLDRPRRILQDCEALGITVLTPGADAYPAALRRTADTPAVLYCLGRLPVSGERPWIGLVGARQADRRGLALARRFGAEIAACGGLVVTGMARGVDAAAAEGALDQGGPVVGVLGSGADVVYPRENAQLFARAAAQGCLLSEYPPGTAPDARHFPARNRIISALSDGIVVIQAGAESGALITARWAADQGRDVFSVPGPPEEPLSKGCNQLLRDGARLAESGLDVMREYAYRYPGTVRMQNAECRMQNEGSGIRDQGSGTCSGIQCAPRDSARPPVEGLTSEQRAIVAALEGGPMQLDALIDKTGLPASQVLPQLTVLQIKKILSQEPGKIYKLR